MVNGVQVKSGAGAVVCRRGNGMNVEFSDGGKDQVRRRVGRAGG